MLRLQLLPEHADGGSWHGSAYIRMLRPFTHPSVLQTDIEANFARRLDDRPCDIVIVDRTWHPGLKLKQVEELLTKARRTGARLWWAVDDNLLDEHPDRPTEARLRGLRPALRLLAREASGIVVSTSALGNRLSTLNKNVVVIENLVDERLLPSLPKECETRQISVVYMGTNTHRSDLSPVLPALRNVLHRHRGEVTLSLVGISSHANVWPHVIMVAPPSYDYPQFISWFRSRPWGIGIAPLAENAFNTCKSDIKLLDYGSCATAAVYSDVPAYDLVRDGVAGVCVPNVPEAWEEALERLILDGDLRTHMGQSAYEHVLQQTLAARGHLWHDAVVTMMTGV